MRAAIIAALLLSSAGVARAQDRPSVSLPGGEARALMAFCPEVGDTSAATIGNGRSGPAFVWRCSGGRAYTCTVGADGVTCSQRSRARAPYPSMVQECAVSEYLSVASGAFNSVWDWKCVNGKPVANPPKEKFDADGYATEEWELVK
jgi:hypothetical protein